MAKVYFTSARVRQWSYEESMPGKLERMLAKAGLMERFMPTDWVAVKTHFGSHGAHRIVRPVFLRKVVDAIKKTGASPFVTDTVRIRGLEYLEVANANGINHLSVGAPVVLADGIFGHDNLMVKAGEILGEVAVASAIHDAQGMVVVSHFKGHINAGFGGAIKNLAMGGVSGSHRKKGWKCGRGAMHSLGDGALEWTRETCTLCYQCREICPLACIEFRADGADFHYDEGKCWRCGRCMRVCPSGALKHQGADEVRFMKGLAEASGAVMSTFEKGKIIYINFLTEMQPECDCMPGADVPVLQDAGIVMSDDMVAVEQASLDLIKDSIPLPDSMASEMGIKAGDDMFRALHARPHEVKLEWAEHLGLGSRQYELVRV